jgi:hypothetical protein
VASKSLGYILGGLEIVAGALLTIFSAGTLAELGIPLIVAGVGTIAGTALTPTPPRQKTLRDSPTYGIDRFENPRGPDAHVPILYGEHRMKPVVIAESVSELSEGVVGNTRQQEFRWLGVVAEGVLDSVWDVRINDREVFSKERDEEIGRGNGNKKEFAFPHRWVFLGDDEDPAVEVFVDGVKKSWTKRSAQTEFTMPTDTRVKTFDLRRDDKRDRILGGTIRVFVRGPGRPESEQLPRVGVYRWSSQKLAAWKVRLRFRTRPPAGYTVRVTFDVLASEGLALVQAGNGVTKAVFGTAPSNGKKVTAKYRTTSFRALRIAWRPGTLDQHPIDGFTDLEQSRNPRESILTRNDPVTYSTEGREVDDLRLGVTAPRGLIVYEDDGGTDPVRVNVRIEYRKLGASSWTLLRTFTFLGERSSTMRWEIDVRDELERQMVAGESGAADALAAFDRASYEVRVTRLSAHSTNALASDEVQFAYVTEVLREGFSYPGTALLGLRGVTTGFLAGSSLRVT